MNVAIRCDASHAIGTGHVMRCLTLADQLRQRGAEVMFICRDHAGHLNDYLHVHGYGVGRLPRVDSAAGDQPPDEYERWLAVPWERDARETADALLARCDRVDWLVVDHYGLGERWERHLRPLAEQIMVIDDLADRGHDCDLLLDQGWYPNQLQRYRDLVSPKSRTLLGPKYALLRPEFIRARKTMRQRDGVVRRILLFFGGVDPTDLTLRAIKAVWPTAQADRRVDVIVGGANERFGAIKRLCDSHPHVTCHRHVDNMAELMAQADLALGGGGTTTWERCFLGLPSVVVTIADNQRAMIEALAAQGAVINAGWHEDVSVENLRALFCSVIEQPQLLKNLSRAALNVMGDPAQCDESPVVSAMMETTHVTA